MKIKTSEVTGAALDWAVAKAKKNIAAVRNLPKVFLQEREQGFHRYSSNWSQGGPILERGRISVRALPSEINVKAHTTFKSGDLWEAETLSHGGDAITVCGTTYLNAGMRCYVASELGDEVEIPEELL